MEKMKVNRAKEFDWLKRQFKYDHKGRPDIYSYGVFKDGITAGEIKDYLRVRSNKWDIRAVEKKYGESSMGDTCPCVLVNSQMVTLFYRHDVERHASKAIDGTATYWD